MTIYEVRSNLLGWPICYREMPDDRDDSAIESIIGAAAFDGM